MYPRFASEDLVNSPGGERSTYGSAGCQAAVDAIAIDDGPRSVQDAMG